VKTFRRLVMMVALSLTAAAAGILVAGTAHAFPVTTGSLSLSGDRHDSVTRGMSYSYSTSNGDTFIVADGDHLIFADANTGVVHIAVDAANGDKWSLAFIAPSGKALAPGAYTVTHNPSTGSFRPGPGLEVGGNGVACGDETGSFTITKAVFGAGGYVQSFDATFEQQCLGATAGSAARGEVHISNPALNPAPKATPTGPATVPTQPSSDISNPTPRLTTTAGTQPGVATGPSPMRDKGSLSRVSFGVPLLLIGAIFWVVVVIAGLLTVGVILAVRRR
jgi:hypothetical protein